MNKGNEDGGGHGLPSVCVYEDGGRYRARAYFGRDGLTGKPVRKGRTLAATDREGAEAEAAAWLSGLAGDGPAMDTADAVGAYVDGLEAAGEAAGTVAKYRCLTRCHIAPAFRGVPVDEVTVEDVERFERGLLMGAGGRAPLAPSTVRSVHFVLKGALDLMRRMGRIRTNPADSVKPPRQRKTKVRALDSAELAALVPLLDAAIGGEGAGTRRGAARAAAWVALRTGVRCAEVCGLTVGDLHARAGEAPRLTVTGTVRDGRGGPWRSRTGKTDTSIRPVPLSDGDAAALRSYIALRDAAAAPSMPLISVSGAFLSPDDVSRVFKADVRSLGLSDDIHFHTLRHTYASIALAAGVDIRTLAEVMGHAKPATTLDTYAHMMGGRDREAAEAFAAALGRMADRGADPCGNE